MLSLLAAESERAPVLVLVDDLQWVDRESAAALGFAARRLREDPVCFVWAARSGSIPPEFVQGMPVLTLAGLSRADARTLVPDRVADGVVERLVDDTGGNPLGIWRSPAASPMPSEWVPRRCRKALPVGDRLGVVYAAATHRLVRTGLARRTAVRAQPLGYLRHGGCGAGPGRSGRCGRAGRGAGPGRLVRHGAEIGFRHPLLRTAVLAMATSAQQRSAHRALAEVLAADPHSLAGTWHRAEAAAGPDQQLAQDLVRAAEQSRTRQGYAAASAAMERAALLVGDAALTADWMATAAADAFLAGDADRTRSLVARVLDGSSPPRAQGRALFTLGMLEEYAGSVPRRRAPRLRR